MSDKEASMWVHRKALRASRELYERAVLVAGQTELSFEEAVDRIAERAKKADTPEGMTKMDLTPEGEDG